MADRFMADSGETAFPPIMQSRSSNSRKSLRRSGTTAVEVALTMPVFAVVMAGLMECGHAMMVVNTLSSAARQAARYGATDGITSAQVVTRATTLAKSAIRCNPTVAVKDGSTFDTAGVDTSNVNFSSLPDIELNTMKSDKLYIVRITVPYESAAILPPFWIKGVTLAGQAVMRHE